jgi:hypothetical protein
MGLLDNVLGSNSNPAVPGGNVTKPLVHCSLRAI